MSDSETTCSICGSAVTITPQALDDVRVYSCTGCGRVERHSRSRATDRRTRVMDPFSDPLSPHFVGVHPSDTRMCEVHHRPLVAQPVAADGRVDFKCPVSGCEKWESEPILNFVEAAESLEMMSGYSLDAVGSLLGVTRSASLPDLDMRGMIRDGVKSREQQEKLLQFLIAKKPTRPERSESLEERVLRKTKELWGTK